jgi:hypothetical protein
VRPGGRTDTIRVALGSIARAEYLRGQHRGGAKALGKAVLIGGAAGALVGAIDGPAKDGPGEEDCPFGCSRRTNAVLLGTLGATLGLLFGIPAAVAVKEDWQPLEPAQVPLRTSIVPTADGARLAIRWSF